MKESFKEIVVKATKQFLERLVFVLVLLGCLIVLVVGMELIEKNLWLVGPIDIYWFIVLAYIPTDHRYFRINFVAAVTLMFVSLATVINIPIIFMLTMLAFTLRGFGFKRLKDWIFEKVKAKKAPVIVETSIVSKASAIRHKLEDLPFDIRGYLFDQVNVGDEIIVPWRLMIDATWEGTIANLQKRLNDLGAQMLWINAMPENAIYDEPAYLVQIIKLN